MPMNTVAGSINGIFISPEEILLNINLLVLRSSRISQNVIDLLDGIEHVNNSSSSLVL
jgi:hypothetical protein